jgi:hypothetical protein
MSFCPSITNGFDVSARSFSFSALYGASFKSTRWLESTTERIGMRLSSLFKFGMENLE